MDTVLPHRGKVSMRKCQINGDDLTSSPFHHFLLPIVLCPFSSSSLESLDLSFCSSIIWHWIHLSFWQDLLLYIFFFLQLCKDKNRKLRLRYKVYSGIGGIGKGKRKLLKELDNWPEPKPNVKSGITIIFFQTRSWTKITPFGRFCET